MLNRRGFLGSLLGLGVAATIPTPTPKPFDFSRAAFSFGSVPLNLIEMQARYVTPAMEALGRDIDAFIARGSYSQRITAADSRRFDPARLPL